MATHNMVRSLLRTDLNNQFFSLFPSPKSPLHILSLSHTRHVKAHKLGKDGVQHIRAVENVGSLTQNVALLYLGFKSLPLSCSLIISCKSCTRRLLLSVTTTAVAAATTVPSTVPPASTPSGIARRISVTAAPSSRAVRRPSTTAATKRRLSCK